MYKKYLVIASKQDKAGMNITKQLSQFRKSPVFGTINKDLSLFDFYFVEESILDEKNLDLEKIEKYDFIIFASKHSSEKEEKTLSIHAPGNWREALTGGKDREICKTSAIFQKQCFQNLNKNAEEHNLKDYNVTLECTHHGPLINKPCIFIEVGSTLREWEDRRAGFIIAKTISETLENFKENPYNEVAIGIGGPHYCPGFNKFQLESNVAISHVIPQYVMPITKEMIKEAWEKTEEEPDFAILDWKGLGKAEQRQEVIDALEELNYPWKKRKDVKR